MVNNKYLQRNHPTRWIASADPGNSYYLPTCRRKLRCQPFYQLEWRKSHCTSHTYSKRLDHRYAYVKTLNLKFKLCFNSNSDSFSHSITYPFSHSLAYSLTYSFSHPVAHPNSSTGIRKSYCKLRRHCCCDNNQFLQRTGNYHGQWYRKCRQYCTV